MDSWATADQVWAGGLIFARIGAILMVMPGFGEAYVPPRIRLSLALLISLVLWPVVRADLPGLPDGLGGMVGWIIREVVTGLMIGLLLRLLMTALTTAGEIVSLQTTLSFAQTANPLQAQPGSTIASFLMLFGVTLIFATDTHHLFIAGIVGSYQGWSQGDGDIDGGVASAPATASYKTPFNSETGTLSSDLLQNTYELRLASNGDARLGWQIGAFYWDERINLVSGTFNGVGNPQPTRVTDIVQKSDSWWAILWAGLSAGWSGQRSDSW